MLPLAISEPGNLHQDHMEHLFLYCLLYRMNYPFHNQTVYLRIIFDPAPPFSSEVCSLYFRNCCIEDRSGLEAWEVLPLFLETHHLLKDGLNLNFHVTWGGQTLNIFVLFLFFFFCLKCVVIEGFLLERQAILQAFVYGL